MLMFPEGQPLSPLRERHLAPCPDLLELPLKEGLRYGLVTHPPRNGIAADVLRTCVSLLVNFLDSEDEPARGLLASHLGVFRTRLEAAPLR